MNGKMRMLGVVALVFLTAAAAGLYYLRQEQRMQLVHDATVLKDATGIVFTTEGPMREVGEDYYRKERVVISSAGELAGFLDTIELRWKGACKCAHETEMVFQTPSVQIPVSFCNHCFDITDSKGIRHYRMPQAFYQEFKRLSKDKGRWQPVLEL